MKKTHHTHKTPLRVAIVSDHIEKATNLLSLYSDSFTIVTSDPDMVISYGGDGTFFRSEFSYPGVPKLYLKHSYIGKLAIKKDNETILDHVARGVYNIVSKTKLDITFNGKTLTAMGDTLIHNKNPRAAIRTKVYLDNELLQEEDIIGDGILVSTQLGSTGYYKSITRSYFESDDQIGLAFSNAIDQINHIVLQKRRVIKVLVTRGVAQVFADNQEEYFELNNGDVLTISVSKATVQVVSL